MDVTLLPQIQHTGPHADRAHVCIALTSVGSMIAGNNTVAKHLVTAPAGLVYRLTSVLVTT